VAERVTIYDVAKAARVSISTVSLALNAPHRVAAATRDKVLRAVDDLGFEPKADAVTRARRGLGRIGVVAPFSSYPSFARRLNGVFAGLADGALDVVVFDQDSAATVPSPLLASLPLTQRLDGIVIMSLPVDDAVAERLQRLQLPTVLVDTIRDEFDSVHTDDGRGGELAAQHLLERGHRRLAVVGEERGSSARLDGFRTAAAAAGAPVPDDAVRLVARDVEHASAAAHALFDLPDPPTAVFAHDDMLAAGVLRAARQRGLTVPNDIAIIGFDDSEIAVALDLTTVRLPFEETGRAGVRALRDRMANSDAPHFDLSLDLELVPRATT
jgi:DNA-binding LacI/PurR family transcriptional regulator